MYPSFFKTLSIDRLICDAWHLAKSKKVAYPSTDNRCLKPFQLLHCDIWGPSPQTDLNGFRWFLVCIDDHGRFAWLYLLKQKSEVTEILKNHSHLIKRQFGIAVQGFRTENVLNFCNNGLRKFFEREGIQHEISYPYTPQQNGLAERKIGDILNKGRTLIEQACVSKTLRGFAVMTTIHLINRLPTKTLSMKSLIETLEKLSSTLRLSNGLSPKVFGCVVYAHDYNPSLDKLSTKAMKCVFVGY